MTPHTKKVKHTQFEYTTNAEQNFKWTMLYMLFGISK